MDKFLKQHEVEHSEVEDPGCFITPRVSFFNKKIDKVDICTCHIIYRERERKIFFWKGLLCTSPYEVTPASASFTKSHGLLSISLTMNLRHLNHVIFKRERKCEMPLTIISYVEKMQTHSLTAKDTTTVKVSANNA